jgi:hypothetical protein
MKLWTKFRISNALDKKVVPDSLRQKIEATAETREYSRQMANLDRALRDQPMPPSAPDTLHQSIMRAVRASSHETHASRRTSMIWISSTSAAAAAIAICIWIIARPAPQSPPQIASQGEQTLAAAQRAWDVSKEVSRTMPAAVVGPLSNELASVDQDVRNTTKFILATLP